MRAIGCKINRRTKIVDDAKIVIGVATLVVPLVFPENKNRIKKGHWLGLINAPIAYVYARQMTLDENYVGYDIYCVLF